MKSILFIAVLILSSQTAHSLSVQKIYNALNGNDENVLKKIPDDQMNVCDLYFLDNNNFMIDQEVSMNEEDLIKDFYQRYFGVSANNKYHNLKTGFTSYFLSNMIAILKALD